MTTTRLSRGQSGEPWESVAQGSGQGRHPPSVRLRLTAGGDILLGRRGLLICGRLFLPQTDDLGDFFPSDFRDGSLGL